jgi:hypothetical protein
MQGRTSRVSLAIPGKEEVMWKFNDPVDRATGTDGVGLGRLARSRRRAPALVISLAVAGGLLLGPVVLPSPSGLALSHGATPKTAPAIAPPAGSTWITGVLTDQAGHRLDGVNVEAWPVGAATAPAASALTYGGRRFNAAPGHGFFRLEVPSDRAYRIAFSALGGHEDGDAFRMMWNGSHRPIMVRAAAAAAAGRVRDLGTIQLARQGRVASKTKAVARRTKVSAGTHGKVRVKVSSSYVTNVTGGVVVKVAGHKMSRKLTTADHGTLVISLPKLEHPGQYRVAVRFKGTSTVQRSKSKPVKVRVVRE